MDTEIRLAIFDWLQNHIDINGNVLSSKILSQGFSYKGERIILIGSKGIWKPNQLKYPISIASDPNGIYDDGFISDDLLKYSYEGTNPDFWTNRLLRDCIQNEVPLIYLHKISKGKYYVHTPVFIVGDDPQRLKFTVAAKQGLNFREMGFVVNEPEEKYLIREYETRLVKQRMHQQTFRELVLDAYRSQCAICNLKHRELLDAAHIIPDSHEMGHAVVSNGLSLCKMHHATYDSNIIGISPDFIVHVREDILQENDGPMLKYGIQSINKQKIILPRNYKDQPDRERLEERFINFMSAC